MERYPLNPEDIPGRFVTFMTGTRADFGKLKPLIRSIYAHSGIYCEIIAVGMHLLRRYGLTINEIHKAGFERIFPLFNQESSTSAKMDLSLANTVTQLSHYLNERRPDMLVVHGDRVEALAGAISGVLNNILVAHVEGGEVSGTADESMRHAISKLAHIHFVANTVAKNRLLQLGEHEDSIFVIGSPEVDIMMGGQLPSLQEAKDHYGIEFDDYAICIYHPVTTEMDSVERGVDQLVQGLERTDQNFIVVEPNNDLGSDPVHKRLRKFAENPRVRMFPSIRFEYYLTLLKNARYIVGNSSSGVREAPVFGVPSVNIGTRQNNRAHNGAIFNVTEDADAIFTCIENLPAKVQARSEFGAGNAAGMFQDVLLSESVWSVAKQKTFVDRPLRD